MLHRTKIQNVFYWKNSAILHTLHSIMNEKNWVGKNVQQVYQNKQRYAVIDNWYDDEPIPYFETTIKQGEVEWIL